MKTSVQELWRMCRALSLPLLPGLLMAHQPKHCQIPCYIPLPGNLDPDVQDDFLFLYGLHWTRFCLTSWMITRWLETGSCLLISNQSGLGELLIDYSRILKEQQIIISQTLQEDILKQLHTAQLGQKKISLLRTLSIGYI